jgi:hypothetical protein
MKTVVCLISCLFISGCVHLVIPAIMSNAYTFDKMDKLEHHLDKLEDKNDAK